LTGGTLLVCSGGGHLKQLFTLAPRLGIEPDDQVWVTFENALSSSLLRDRRVVYVPFAAPRDAVNASRIALIVRRLLKAEHFGRAISTGSSPAVAVLPQTAQRGIESHYIESAARADGPSVSGRLVARFRRISTYTQYPVWADERWRYRGSIFDAFAEGASHPVAPPIRRAVVSVGTQEGYGFSRLFAALAPLLVGVEVLWQSGTQDVSDYGIAGRPSVPHDELAAAVAEADVVVAHAGTGAALTAIEAGKCPVLVPRLARYREHVDDHQVQIAAELSGRGLAVSARPEQLSVETLAEAARRTTVAVAPSAFDLVGLAAAS
jgi:UDP-N-acetylglucosamine transferase subunit ALG13